MSHAVAAPAAGRDAFWRDAALLVLALLAVHALNLAVHRDLWVQDGPLRRVLRDAPNRALAGAAPERLPVSGQTAGVASGWSPALRRSLTSQGEQAFRLFTLLSTVAATFGTLGARATPRRSGRPGAGRHLCS